MAKSGLDGCCGDPMKTELQSLTDYSTVHTAVMSLSKMAFIAMGDVGQNVYRKYVRMQVDVQNCCLALYNVVKMMNQSQKDGPTVTDTAHMHEDGFGFVCVEAAANGHLNCLVMAHEIGIPWDRDTTRAAAAAGSLDCLQYAHEQGCPWDEETCAEAAAGRLECLRYARENGCPWDNRTCERAAFDGHLRCLKYARAAGCPWDEQTCRLAASNGHLDCLSFARDNGCPWDGRTCAEAAAGGHIGCLRYAYEHGCPWDGNTPLAAAINGNLECMVYALENRCDWDRDRCIESLEHYSKEFHDCHACLDYALRTTAYPNRGYRGTYH